MSFLKSLTSGIENTNILSEGKNSSEFSGTIDTGSYILNAAFSGSIYGGVPDNKIVAFAGESTTGKTFFALGIIKKFLDDNPDGAIVYFDTEAAVTRKMMEDRGVDADRVAISEPSSIEEFRTNATRILNEYEKDKNRPPLMLVLDSLGQLSSAKELDDVESGSEKRDMTKSQLLRGTFRVLSLKLAKLGVTMLVTNHVYDVIGSYFPTKEMSGGKGLKYSASTIVMLSKKKDKKGTEVIGNIIKCRFIKSRFTKEHTEIEVQLSYDNGLSRYYGLLAIAEKYGIIEKVGKQYLLADGRKVFGKTINNDPESVYTPEILAQLDKACAKEFLYGTEDELVSEEA